MPPGPIGFQIDILRSAAGRSYIALCDSDKRETILERLKLSQRKGDQNAKNDE